MSPMDEQLRDARKIAGSLMKLADKFSSNNSLSLTEVQTFMSSSTANQSCKIATKFAKWLTSGSQWRKFDENR